MAEAPPLRKLAAVIMPAVDHMIQYHVVTRGACWDAIAGETRVRLEAGDVILFPHGDAHVISSAPGLRASTSVDRTRLLQLPERPVFINFRGEMPSIADPGSSGEAETTVVYGFFGCDVRPFNPLIASLPRLLRVPAADGDWIERFMRFAVAEAREQRPGGNRNRSVLREVLVLAQGNWVRQKDNSKAR